MAASSANAKSHNQANELNPMKTNRPYQPIPSSFTLAVLAATAVLSLPPSAQAGSPEESLGFVSLTGSPGLKSPFPTFNGDQSHFFRSTR